MMLKKIFVFIYLSFSLQQSISQVLYSERFNTLSLTTATNSALQTYFYSDISNGMFTINNGNLIADTLTANYPFRANGQKQKAWLGYLPANSTDTFAVSTSWLKPTGTAGSWLITPTINNIAINTVLSWEAMAPDINNLDGYEVYITTNTSTVPVVSDFTTQLFITAAEKNTWQTHGISLSNYVGQNIRIAFKNNSTDKYQLWLDDIKVENINNAFDASAVTHEIYKYSVINTNNTLAATFKNNGYTPITNLTINYKMDNGVTVSEIKILSPALNYLESRVLNFTVPYFSNTPVYKTYKIWTSAINGSTDQLNTNDTITGAITISSLKPTKKVLVEEFTGAWCGWCPNGYSNLTSIASTNTNVIATSLHNNDNMTEAATNYLYTAHGSTDNISLAMVDRYLFNSNVKFGLNINDWNTYINQRQAMVVPVSVSVTAVNYNSTTRQIDATVSASFVGDVKGQHHLNLYIKENNVYGPVSDNTDNQWNQHNSLFNISSSPYYQLGTYLNSNTYLLSPNEYKHQYVINSFIDGWAGDPSFIPTNASTNGQTYSKTYSYTLPNTLGNEFRYNADNIYLIGVISEYDPANYNPIAILNSCEVKLTTNAEVLVGVKENNKADIQINIFPNPTSTSCNLNYTLQSDELVTVSVYNTLGELVYIETKNVNAGNVTHELNISELHSGNYSVQISINNNSITKKLTIIK